MDIVHFRDITASYLEQSSGKQSHTLLQMAKNGLVFELHNLLHIKIKSLRVGPLFSYLLKQTDTFSGNMITTQQIQEFKNDNVRKNMLGIVAGLDVNIGHAVLCIRAGKDYLNNNGDRSLTIP